MHYGYFRVAAGSLPLRVADPDFNSQKIVEAAKAAAKKKCGLLVLPELCITGYTCADLFFQKPLLDAALLALQKIAEKTADLPLLLAAGLPVQKNGMLYNAAAVLFKGQILALVPKTFIPNYAEFYEARYFSSAKNLSEGETFFLSKKFPALPFSKDILFCSEKNPSLKIAFEICEDLWAPAPPSVRHALAGATVIANLSASNETVGKAEYRRLLAVSASAKNFCCYAYADAGSDESTQDAVFAGHNLICENGKILAQSELFKNEMIFSDVDLELLESERTRTTTFSQCRAEEDFSSYKKIFLDLDELNFQSEKFFFRKVQKFPFVPESSAARNERCREVITLQAHGLAKRLRHTGAKKVVVGLSGGLDSTLALLVSKRAFEICGLKKSGIIAITMPGFGTTDRTYKNACLLAREVGAALREIPIAPSVRQHFFDIGHDEKIRDAVYENAQARERTQILMDMANKEGAIAIGTGDLSELALGWCTYNGDHMSMYGVNSSVPKTLVRHIVRSEADLEKNERLASVLRDILSTPVSPELLPPEQNGISQKTEEIVGPYELHDFFLYHILRFGFSPKKIFFLAKRAFCESEHSEAKIKSWMKVFYARFFSQQFKRSCMPDGAKVGTVSLSPRADFRMPSDACSALWLSEVDAISLP